MCPGNSDVNPLGNVEGIIDRSACPERYLLFGHTFDLAPGTYLTFAGSTESLHQIPMGFLFCAWPLAITKSVLRQALINCCNSDVAQYLGG